MYLKRGDDVSTRGPTKVVRTLRWSSKSVILVIDRKRPTNYPTKTSASVDPTGRTPKGRESKETG